MHSQGSASALLREQPLPDLPTSLLGPETGDELGAGSTRAQPAPMVTVTVPRCCEAVAEDLRGRQFQESRDKGGAGAHAATGGAVPRVHRQADRGQHQPQGRDKALASRVQNQDLVQGLV